MCDFEFIDLKFGQWTAKICPSFGMNVCALAHSGKEILRSPENLETLKSSPYLYGIPLLFPANRTKMGEFQFDGKMYRLPLNEPERGNHIHGLMFDAPFTVNRKTESCICAVYENVSERYPFPFRMEITDSLSEKGFHRVVSMLNAGNAPFPYTLAFHTTFKEPECMRVFIQKRFVCDENYIPTGEFAKLNALEKQYASGISPNGHALSGFYVSNGNKAYLDEIAFCVSDNFDEWVLFNAGGDKGFVCIEPQAGQVNGLNTKDGLRILNAGETQVFTLSITREEDE